MLYVTCTTITSVDLAHYGVSRAKGWVSVDSTIYSNFYKGFCIGSTDATSVSCAKIIINKLYNRLFECCNFRF